MPPANSSRRLAGPPDGLVCWVQRRAPFYRSLASSCWIGSAADNDLVVQDPAVSRHHALLRRRASGRWWVVDLASTNGTWLNGERIPGAREVRDGDVIRLGRTTRLRACLTAPTLHGNKRAEGSGP